MVTRPRGLQGPRQRTLCEAPESATERHGLQGHRHSFFLVEKQSSADTAIASCRVDRATRGRACLDCTLHRHLCK